MVRYGIVRMVWYGMVWCVMVWHGMVQEHEGVNTQEQGTKEAVLDVELTSFLQSLKCASS